MDNFSVGDFADRGIILYGAGFCGAMMTELLSEQGLAPLCIFDRDPGLDGGKLFGVPVMTPRRNESRRDALVIVCILSALSVPRDVRGALNALGYRTVVHIYDLKKERALFRHQKIIISPDVEAVRNARGRFERMKAALADDGSQSLLDKIERYLLGEDAGEFPALPVSGQYFAYDLYRRIPDEAVIDAGGFKGEVMDWFMRFNDGRFLSYHIVEPDWHYHESILNRARAWNREAIHLHPCALSDRRETLRLRNYANANSVVVPDGEIEARAYPVDELFSAERCTLLKIDVEGWEKQVLEGARETICRNRPVIAAATYHYETEFFELFEAIRPLTPDYSYYLRSYMNIQETVLYAIPRERKVQADALH